MYGHKQNEQISDNKKLSTFEASSSEDELSTGLEKTEYCAELVEQPACFNVHEFVTSTTSDLISMLSKLLFSLPISIIVIGVL
jgi:hypothetical protein